MGVIRSAPLLLPGSYGLNSKDEIAADQALRFAGLASNGVIDASGKLVSREDFVNQSGGEVPFSVLLETVYTHRNDDGTETIMSAGEGRVFSGIAGPTVRHDYRAGSQIVDVGGAKAGASATGLANDGTAYTATVVIDGVTKNVSVVGSASQTYTTLLAGINTDLGAAGTAAIVGGNIKITSATTGDTSTVEITAGTLFTGSLPTGFVAIRAASDGTTANNNWQFASLNGRIYMAQAGQHLTCLNESSYAVESVVAQPWTSSPNCVIAAYGRLWVADDAAGSDRYTIWWSDILDGKAWTGGDAGEISLKNAWPQGQDSIVAICAAFGRLIVFGTSAILMYTLGSDNDPGAMTLTSQVGNVGCIARDSVVVADDGVYFLSAQGVMRINTLAQVTSLLATPPMTTLVNADVQATYAAETLTKVRAGYHPVNGWYVINAPTANKCYVLHTRVKLPQLDLPAITTWTNVGMPFRGFCFDASRNWYCAGTNGVHKYTGYTTDGANNVYTFDFYTQWLNFGAEERLKHLKYVVLTLSGVSGVTGTGKWQIDYKAGTTYTASFTGSAVEFAENPGIGEVKFHIGRSCNVAKVGFSVTVTAKVTLHQMKLFAQTGKTTFR
jgi:hypothetical protein